MILNKKSIQYVMPVTTKRWTKMALNSKVTFEPAARAEVYEKSYHTSYLLAFSLAITTTIASTVFVP